MNKAVSEGENQPHTAGEIREHMMVHAMGEGSHNGVEGVHVGTVDCIEGVYIKLTKSDSPDGKHHLIPLAWVAKVDPERNVVFLNKDPETVRNEWHEV